MESHQYLQENVIRNVFQEIGLLPSGKFNGSVTGTSSTRKKVGLGVIP